MIFSFVLFHHIRFKTKKNKSASEMMRKSYPKKLFFTKYWWLDCFVASAVYHSTLEWCCLKNEQIQLTRNRQVLPLAVLTMQFINFTCVECIGCQSFQFSGFATKLEWTVSGVRAYIFFALWLWWFWWVVFRLKFLFYTKTAHGA